MSIRFLSYAGTFRLKRTVTFRHAERNCYVRNVPARRRVAFP